MIKHDEVILSELSSEFRKTHVLYDKTLLIWLLRPFIQSTFRPPSVGHHQDLY